MRLDCRNPDSCPEKRPHKHMGGFPGYVLTETPPMYGPNISNPMNQSPQFPHSNLSPKASELIKEHNTNMENNQADKESIRTGILMEANKLTSGDRNKTYGPPIDNLTTYADLCDAYLKALPPGPLDAVDGSVLMILAKISRIPRNKNHRDNYVDGSAYFAIAGECAELLKQRELEAGKKITVSATYNRTNSRPVSSEYPYKDIDGRNYRLDNCRDITGAVKKTYEPEPDLFDEGGIRR